MLCNTDHRSDLCFDYEQRQKNEVPKSKEGNILKLLLNSVFSEVIQALKNLHSTEFQLTFESLIEMGYHLWMDCKQWE